MKKINKIISGLGALGSIIAPIAVAGSCGSIQMPSDAELDNYRKLSTSEAQRLFEEKWAEQVMQTTQASDVNFGYWKVNVDETTPANNKWEWVANKRDDNGQYTLDVSKSTRLRDVARFIIKEEIAKDKSFLNKFATQILGDRISKWYDETNNGKAQEKVDTKYLQDIGLARVYEVQNAKEQIIFGDKAATAANNLLRDDAINLMLNYAKSSFRLMVYKQVVAEEYLLHTNAAEYKAAFKSEGRNFSLIQQDIQIGKFALINEEISQKLFAKWTIEVKDTNVNSVINKQYANAAAALTAMKIDGTTIGELAAKLNWSVTKTRSFEDILTTGFTGGTAASEYQKITGWQGLLAQSPVGSKRLSFSYEKSKEVTSVGGWEGFLQDNDLILASDTTTKINVIPDKQTTGSVSYLKGIMPIYENNKFVNKFDETLLARILAYKNTSVYKKASEFYRTKVEGRTADDGTTDMAEAIYLQLTDNAAPIKKILDDQSFEFTKVRDAE